MLMNQSSNAESRKELFVLIYTVVCYYFLAIIEQKRGSSFYKKQEVQRYVMFNIEFILL